MKSDREPSFDLVKAVLIWLVVLGHLIQFVVYFGRTDLFSDRLSLFIYTFHMPLFMAISGYFLKIHNMKRISLWSIVEKRGLQLLLPMAVWVAMGMAVRLAITNNPTDLTIFIFIKQLIQSMFDSYWFLWSVFLSYFAVGILAKSEPNSIYRRSYSRCCCFLCPLPEFRPWGTC